MKKQTFIDLDLSQISGHELDLPELNIHLTSACSHAECQHCIIKDEFSSCFLSLNDLRKIFSEMDELGIPFVSFSGGEPFEYEEGIENAIKLAQENNIFVTQIITNGFFAKDENKTLQILKNIKNQGFSHLEIDNKVVIPSLTISMDLEHMKFISIENIRTLIKCSKEVFENLIDLRINYVIFPGETKQEIFQKYPWLKEIDVNFGKVFYEGRGRNLENKELVKIIDYLEEWSVPCNWINNNVIPTIFPNGKINFCCFGFNEIFSLGNIKYTSLRNALSRINRTKILQSLFRYGPTKLITLNKTINEKYTYGKCGLCNLLMSNSESNHIDLGLPR